MFILYVDQLKCKKIVNNICCIPDQWEGLLFLGYGTVFQDNGALPQSPKGAPSYINGTVKIAYDFANSRTYTFMNTTTRAPYFPNPIFSVGIVLTDFKTVSLL